MLELQGKYASAKIFTNLIEDSAVSQIIEMCNQEYVKDSKIRIMPDVHAGAGCTIGTTMTISDKVCPNLVGVDIGCGIEVVRLKEKNIDLEKLDLVIRKYVPSGFSIRNTPHPLVTSLEQKFDKLICKQAIDINRAMLSIGTLGGGNHFIEINKDEDENLYLVVHSGSRNFGKQIAEYYQNLAYERMMDTRAQKEKVIQQLKKLGLDKLIQSTLEEMKVLRVNKDLAYLTGNDFYNYLKDIAIAQYYAYINRRAIIVEIMREMNLNRVNKHDFTTIHNYIDTHSKILRKGAISAEKGEEVLIPMNMRDGSLICIGKGNEDWNQSAPHGAGRLMSRAQAKRDLNIESFKKEMSSVWTSCVNESTLDEAPMAYKPMAEITKYIAETADIVKIIKPIYNYKAN